MKHALLFRLLAFLLALWPAASTWAQVTLTTSPYTENFDDLETAQPTGFSVRTGATATVLGTPVAAFPTAEVLWNNTSGAFKNFASATGLEGTATAEQQNNAPNRALGVRQTGSFGEPGAAFTLQLANTVGKGNLVLTFALQSLDATSTRTTTWRVDYGIGATPTTFTPVATTPETPATGGSTFSSTPVTANFGTALNNINEPIWIRVVALAASTGAGNRPSSAIDDFSLAFNSNIATSPSLSVAPTSLIFDRQALNTNSEPKSYTLTGSSLTANVTATAPAGFALSKSNAPAASSTPTLTFTPAELATAQTVYVRFTPTTGGITSGTITHTSTGAEAKNVVVSGTGIDPNNNLFSFNVCPSGSTSFDTWTAFSVTGPQTWGCTTFGRAANDPTNRASAPNGLQINGFASGASVSNEDWLISPAFDLSTFQFPRFSFWSRVAFSGAALRLRVSTNYTGTGSPTAAGVTWTDLNADFPGSGSDVWTLTPDVDLTRFKGPNVYLAFVYTSGPEVGAARWTLDDLRLQNANAPAAPVLLVSPASLAFGYQAVNAAAQQTLTATFRNLTGPVTIASSDPAFQLAKSGTSPFSNSLTYTVEEANFTSATVSVRFTPTLAARSYTATLTASTAGAANVTVAVAGNTYAPDNTLDVVNWNIEWFGSPAQAPTNDDLQQANALTMLTNLNADVYGLVEVVDTARLGAVVRQLPGSYKYKVADFGSNAPDNNDPDYVSAQKLVFVYRTSVVSNPTFSGLLRCPNNGTTCPQYNAWSSGRFPYLMEADVTVNGQTQRINFVLIHAKANENTSVADAQAAYDRRKVGADALKAELDARFGTGNVVILGDFNDDLDQTVASGINTTATSYSAFTADAANYVALTLPLSQTGQRSTVDFGDVIDHVVVSSELNAFYLPSTAQLRTDLAAQIPNYANTTSDHYPVLTRFAFGYVTASSSARQANTQLDIYPNPATDKVQLRLPASAGQSVRMQVMSTDGRAMAQAAGSLEQVNQRLNQQLANLSAGVYILRIITPSQTYVKRFVKQ
ncbi:Endonuclease/exonuclease/phosphatase [Hymenobacter roseosalivarius DSM 11622]|uniref:Endonuclease/exonuclease/phosphatase n=1 Tax=Hymenobacter roseosalivarius DSM 11622 TaxID=645990 RepID=A0A1W1VZI3_9BACT|nr:T9SS type A sorting domain-containing protein [Hymenobacter roseosalivarius]SMB98765.1 Endonuclease/exonuclease/phosphatase [Hymenobacter roseosalivarius DSM 11622]